MVTDPHNITIINDLESYTRQNNSIYEHHQGHPYRTLDTWTRYLPGWKASYEALCRGETLMTV